MELYTLDGLLRRTELVEGFESFIWAERYNGIGDISIVTPSTTQFRNLLAVGTYLGLSESRRVMKVKTITDISEEDGTKQLKITGQDILSITQDRIARAATLGANPGSWKITGTKPSDVIRAIFNYVCRTGSLKTEDIIPFLQGGSLYGAGNLPEDENLYTIERDKSDLYSAMKELADVWDLGLRLYKGNDDTKLYFDVYKGNDRTSSQTTLPAVIFSEALDSLQSVSELTSLAKSKNVAHVQGKYSYYYEYSEGASTTTAGLDRRVLLVDATDIEYEPRTNTILTTEEEALNKLHGLAQVLGYQKDAIKKVLDRKRFADYLGVPERNVVLTAALDQFTAGRITAGERTLITTAVNNSTALEAAETVVYEAALSQRGQEELAKNRSISAIDGEISQSSPYKYSRDYDLGDQVEMRSSAGTTTQMLVTEQIFVSDELGERAYPTLSQKLYVTPGSWLAWENTQVWLDAPGTWATS